MEEYKLKKESLNNLSEEKKIFYNDELFNNNLRIINSYCDNKIINNESIILLIKTLSREIYNAFLRPGRIDFITELTYGKKNQLKEMYDSYFNDNNFNKIYESLKSKKITTGAFHKFLFEKRDSPNLINEIDFLNNLIECDDKISNLYI